MLKKSSELRPGLLSLSVSMAVAAMTLGGTVPVALAQDADDLEEIVVTGSRIVRRDYEANSPLVSVEASDLENQSGLNVESYLNQLPNFNPAASPVTTQSDIQPTAVNSVGIASVSLRGFGPNRNLVLVNGKRPTPNNALMVTDLNAIPSSMIERVEIITGGASAVYGADAIGGVTNFMLRKNFEGMEFDIQSGVSESGDGEEFRISAVVGTDFADGRGNVTLALEHYNRQEALQRNRDFYTESWSDPNQPSDDLFVYGSSGIVTNSFSFNGPDRDAIRSLFPDSPLTTSQFGTGPFVHRFRTGPNGEIWTILGDNLSKYESLGGSYNQEFAKVNNFDTTIATPGQQIETLKWNDLEAYTSSPQERYSFYGSANFDITDKINFFSSVNFSESNTRTLLYGTVPIWGWESSAPFDPNTDSPLDPTLDWTDPALVAAAVANRDAYLNPNFIGTGEAGAGHPVPDQVAMLLMMRPTPDANYSVELYPSHAMPRRTTENTVTYWQFEAGLNFELPFKDWSGEVYWSHGESNTLTISRGNLSLTRWRALVNSPDWGRGLGTDPANPVEGNFAATLDGFPGSPSWVPGNSGFGAPQVQCTSGLYDTFFGGDINAAAAPSEDCQNLVAAPLQTTRKNQQDVIELNAQGGLFDLPAGEVRAAIGLSYRDNASQFNPDQLQSYFSFTDQVVGLYPASYLDASTDTSDIYGELLVPVVSDVKFIQRLELELGYRYSEYEFADSTDTYKFLANWELNDSWRFRGGFNRANRAPNLGELFLNKQEVYLGASGASFGDACGLRSNATYGAGGVLPDPDPPAGAAPTEIAAGQTPEGALSTYLICTEQMGAAAANDFYFVNRATGATASFGDWWRLQQGNPNLDSEEADTISLGFVFNSNSSSPWLENLTATFDWWQVDINNAIQQYSPDYAGYLCYGTRIVTNAAEAAEQAATRGCQNVPRSRVTGAQATKLVEYDNQATIETSGFDISLNWFADFESLGWGSMPGGIGITTQGTVLDYYKTKQSPANYDVEIDWKGSLGPDLEGTNPGAYDYRFFTSFSYILNDLSVNLRWRYLPETISASAAAQNAIITNNQRVAAGAGGDSIIINYTPNQEVGIDAYSVFDLSMGWQINDIFSLRAGIDNVFDTKPSITAQTRGVSVADMGNVCAGMESVGCVNPTTPSLARTGSGTTSPGFYDTLGRRFFVGLKARF